MVGEPEEIDVQEFEWDEWNTAHLAEHGVLRSDVDAVRLNAPLFFANLPDRSGSHVMIGPDAAGGFFYVVLVESERAGVWRVITAYRYARRRALRYYRRAPDDDS